MLQSTNKGCFPWPSSLYVSDSGVLDGEPTLWAYLQPLSSVSPKHSLLSNCRFESPTETAPLAILPRANEEEATARMTTNENQGPCGVLLMFLCCGSGGKYSSFGVTWWRGVKSEPDNGSGGSGIARADEPPDFRETVRCSARLLVSVHVHPTGREEPAGRQAQPTSSMS